MKKVYESLVLLFFISVIIGVGIGSVAVIRQTDETRINEWAVENGHSVKEIEECYFVYGPYWYKDKNQRIYKISLNNNKIFWMRTGLFSNEYLEQ